MVGVVALAQELLTYAKGLFASYDLINGRLTAVRAGELDNLTRLTGPVALQADLGTAADAAGTQTSVFAFLQYIDQQVKGQR